MTTLVMVVVSNRSRNTPAPDVVLRFTVRSETAFLGMLPESCNCTVMVPELDLILVRNGKSPLEQKDAVMQWMGDVADAFRG